MPETGAGAFITLQSLASFSGASSVVYLCLGLLKRLGLTADWAVLVVAAIVGGIVFVLSVTDPTARPRNKREWLGAIVSGVVNSLQLAAAAYGIQQTVR